MEIAQFEEHLFRRNLDIYPQLMDKTKYTQARKDSELFENMVYGNELKVHWWLEMGASLNGYKTFPSTALHHAARDGNIRLLAMLLDRKANPNSLDQDGKTPLFYAKDKQTAQMLSARGADLHALDYYGRNCLMEHTIHKNSAMMSYLLDVGVDIQFINSVDGNSALHYAVEEWYCDGVKILTERGCALEARNNHGYSPLQLACAELYLSDFGFSLEDIINVVTQLVKSGANVNATSEDTGDTPMMQLCASKYNCDSMAAMIKCLCDNGAEISIRNSQGKNARDLCLAMNRMEIASIIQSYERSV